MIKLVKLTKNPPTGDYVLDKEETLEKIVVSLTPKFDATWNIVLIDPSIAFTLALIDSPTFPEWVDVTVCTNAKKIDRITEVKPSLLPKEETVRDAYVKAVSDMRHMISDKASKYLFESLRSNKEALLATLHKLDTECDGTTVELKDVQAEVVKPNIVYASKVVDAFLTADKQRWKLYEKLQLDAGATISYYAVRKYVNRLLKEKDAYLHNEDVRDRILSRVPATDICLLYSLMASSNNPLHLTAIFLQFEQRSNYTIKED